MNRFFGLMPMDEVKMERTFHDCLGNSVIVQAGPHGWGVLAYGACYPFEDTDDTTENNFKKAYDAAVANHGPLTAYASKEPGES